MKEQPITPPNVRVLVAALFMAGLARPRRAPEADLSPLGIVQPTWEAKRGAYFVEGWDAWLHEWVQHPRIVAVNGELVTSGGIILPGGHA